MLPLRPGLSPRRPSASPARWPGIAEPLATLRERLLGAARRGGGRHWTPRRATASRRSAARSTAARWTPLAAWRRCCTALDRDRRRSPATGPTTCCSCGSTGCEGGREIDVGLHRHWLDPTIPFAATLAAPAHGLLVTSATLRDAGDARSRSRLGVGRGAGRARRICRRRRSAPRSPARSTTPPRPAPSSSPTSPRGDIDPAGRRLSARCSWPPAAAALGLFTAIRRLRAVHARIAPGAGGGRHPALRPARRCDGQRHPGRHLPHRGGELPARHRCDARRRRRARPRAAPGGVRARALAAPRHPASGAAHASRRTAIRRATTTASPGCGCARRSAG